MPGAENRPDLAPKGSWLRLGRFTSVRWAGHPSVEFRRVRESLHKRRPLSVSSNPPGEAPPVSHSIIATITDGTAGTLNAASAQPSPVASPAGRHGESADVIIVGAGPSGSAT